MVTIYLGGVVPKGFKFQRCGNTNAARFMQKSLYYLKLKLLSSHINFLTDKEKEEIESVSEFVGLFWAVWFLKCPMAADAPENDLLAIKQMRMYKGVRPEAATTCCQSLERHLWYLTPELVVLALASESLAATELKSLADTLIHTNRPKYFAPVKPTFPGPGFTQNDEIWGDNGNIPSLARLVNERSWLMFHLLEMGEDDTEWLREEVNLWERFDGYRRFRKFVVGLTVVNDPAERGVKLIQVIKCFKSSAEY